MNEIQKLEIKRLKDRAMGLMGQAPDGTRMSDYIAKTLDEISGADEAKAAQLIREALNDPDKARQLAEVRLIQTGIYLLPSLVFGRMFEIVTLAEGDQAVIYNESQMEITVGYIGDGNKPRMMKVEAEQNSQVIQLRNLATERVRYQLIDLQRGRIDQSAQKNFDLAFDMRNKMDSISYALLTASVANGGAYGAFVTTGDKTARSYIRNSRVLAEHLPSTNDINVGTPSSSTKFSFDVLNSILEYANAWGDSWSDGPLQPTGEIYVPSSDIKGIASVVTSVSEPTNIQEEIRRNGYISGFIWMGIPWKFIPVNTIPKGTCYAVFNKPVGKLFLKPSLDRERTKRDDDENWEERWQIKVIGMAIPETDRVNTARFTYYTV